MTLPQALRARLSDRSSELRRLATFAAIGLLSTLAYAALFALLRGSMTAQGANLGALAITTVGNTAANRRLTFNVRGRARLLADQAAGFVAFGIALVISALAIGLLELVVPRAGVRLELAVVIAASAFATVIRYLVLRSWMERSHPPARRPAVVPEGATR